jgi:hypothetical protein
MIIINFVEYNDIIVFADKLKGEDFVKSLPKSDITNGKIIVTRN